MKFVYADSCCRKIKTKWSLTNNVCCYVVVQRNIEKVQKYVLRQKFIIFQIFAHYNKCFRKKCMGSDEKPPGFFWWAKSSNQSLATTTNKLNSSKSFKRVKEISFFNLWKIKNIKIVFVALKFETNKNEELLSISKHF